jgi:peptidyl-prolyl cis-trans isomerase C
MQATLARPAVNGVPLQSDDEHLPLAVQRQRACTELLRQAAMRTGLLAPDDPAPVDGATSPAAAAAIERLLERELAVPEPSEEACRRHYAAHPQRHAVGERVQARHVLFAVTPGADLAPLRQRAEACLIDLRCEDGGNRFAQVARETSNCPSGAEGGQLGSAPATVRPSSPANCSPARRSACCPGWCTAASACMSSKCWRASRARCLRSRPCARRSRNPCASRAT